MSATTERIWPTIVTADWLDGLDPRPCIDAVHAFRREWPNGCEVTEETANMAVAVAIDLVWFAKNHFTAQAWQEYERVRAPALQEYERFRAPAWQEYERVTAQAFVAGWRAAFGGGAL